MLHKPQGATERQALDWNPQGARKRSRPRINWKRTTETELDNV
jgi:hypothetical protein